MKKLTLVALLFVLALAVCGLMACTQEPPEETTGTQAPTNAPTEPASEAPTEVPTEAPTEPEEMTMEPKTTISVVVNGSTE